ncbi:hypothetical protein A8135_01175 [Legionella jamestowniensis]|uniref:Uncharacterized protein n=1 Tax=Legionella jamestowniensis TaxID=455 RepID=A0ABX2XTB2_9GAMM|nr:hypothetical protein [Legionella jamestowniensis]OCH97864.1 hypothetical protein A8135_01175 [Legionella jamestowniensis]
MFFLKKKAQTEYNSTEFDIFENKIHHISYSAKRQFSQRSYEEPYLWTSNLTACVGVGLRSQEGKHSRIELYHSASEHYLENIEIDEALNDKNEFVSMLYYFLNQVTDTRHLKIYVACDPLHSNPSRDTKYIHNGVNKCIDYINKSQSKSLKKIGFSQVEARKVEAGTFYITATGKAGTLEDALSESLHKIQGLFADVKLADSELYTAYLQLTQERGELDSFGAKKVFFETLQDLASTYLSEAHVPKHQTAEQLAIKLVSWDLFLNGPDSQLFNNWQEKHTSIQYEAPPPYV